MSILHDINAKITEAAQASADVPAEIRTAVSTNHVVRRYQDAYTVAKTANAFGNFTKTIGLVSAAIIGLLGFVIIIFMAGFGSVGAGFILFLTMLSFAALVGALFYIMGIVLSALGQNLMASLDTAVNGSPFMSQDQKAQAMDITA